MSFTAAIIGRPNVGKSTLFNRLVGKRLALVDDTPGVTRDRRLADAAIGDLAFKVIDTAGFEEAGGETLEARMRAQTERAIEEADIAFFVIDARAGVTPDDKAFAALLRRHDAKVVLIANKMEGKAAEAGYYEAFSLGFGDAVPFSAEHGQGLGDLYNAVVEAIGEERAHAADDDGDAIAVRPEIATELEGNEIDASPPVPEDVAEDAAENDEAPEDDPTKPLQIAIAGRPNAGKSTLINHLLGEERLLTGPEAGITRDSIAVEWNFEGRSIRLFDTAGMRRKARVQEKLEKLSVADALRAIQFAEVVIVLIDAANPFEKQDIQIADLVIREGRAPVIAVNKWDLVEDRRVRLAEIKQLAEESLPQIRGLKLVPISAETGEGVDRLMRAVLDVYRQWNRRIATARLNRWLDEMQYRHPPPAVAGRRIRLKYITQAKTRPPTFMVHCSRPEALPASYSRYLVNNLREDFELYATPIRLLMRKGGNPYVTKRKKA